MATSTIKNITPTNIGAVAKSGDTMSGNLSVEAATGSEVEARTKSSNGYYSRVSLKAQTGGAHGVQSPGYYNGSNFVSDVKWLIYRFTDGKVHVENHYSKDEVDAKCLQPLTVEIRSSERSASFNVGSNFKFGFLIGYSRTGDPSNTTHSGHCIVYVYDNTAYIDVKTEFTALDSVSFSNGILTVNTNIGYMTLTFLPLY